MPLASLRVDRVRGELEAQQGSGQVRVQVRLRLDVADLAAVLDDGLHQFLDDVGDLAQGVLAERALLPRAGEQPVAVADDSRGDGLRVHGQRPDRGQRGRPQSVVEPDRRVMLGRDGLEDLADQSLLLLVGAVGDKDAYLVPDVGGGRGVAVDGEAADEPVVQVTGEELDEGRYLIGVPADGQQIEAPSLNRRLSSPMRRR